MIRPYDKADKPKLLALCREFWNAACADDYGQFDEDHTSQKLDSMLLNGVCFVNDDVTGMIILCESTNLCNPSKIAAELAWYVSPSARGSDGIKLIKSAFKYCELKNIKFLSMMYMQSSMPDSILKMYDKMGLTLRETTYVKRF